jgi:hypothetical protein
MSMVMHDGGMLPWNQQQVTSQSIDITDESDSTYCWVPLSATKPPQVRVLFDPDHLLSIRFDHYQKHPSWKKIPPGLSGIMN